MTTTTRVINSNKSSKNNKPIVFEKVFDGGNVFNTDKRGPSDWKYIDLIGKNDSYDVMFAYDNPDSRIGVVYIGKWNDGTVSWQSRRHVLIFTYDYYLQE